MIIEGIRTLLDSSERVRIVGSASGSGECLAFFEKQKAPDVVLMDINMPGMSGIELCAILKKNYPEVKVLALSTFDQGSYVTKMVENGARGYVLKNAEAEELEEAVRQVYEGQLYFSLEIRSQFYDARNKESKLKFPILTPREKEVLILIAQGYTNPAIAEKLFVSLTTIESHRKNLYSKLKVKNTATLIRFALDNNLLDSPSSTLSCS
jgi:DNA-binding NarL/FixJ family response regulator